MVTPQSMGSSAGNNNKEMAATYLVQHVPRLKKKTNAGNRHHAPCKKSPSQDAKTAEIPNWKKLGRRELQLSCTQQECPKDAEMRDGIIEVLCERTLVGHKSGHKRRKKERLFL